MMDRLPNCYRCGRQPCECRDGITLYHADCREVLPLLEPGSVESVVSDPPYGMNLNTNTKRFSGGRKEHQRGPGRNDYGSIVGDSEDFDPSPWIAFDRVVLWGFNHFSSRVPHGTVLVWLKKDSHLLGTFLSDCELAWKKGGCGVYAFGKSFPPPLRLQETGTTRSVHPTQKPLSLMKWSIEHAGGNGTILDPFAGSGTTGVAALLMGRRCILIECEQRYCEIAKARLSQKVLAFSLSDDESQGAAIESGNQGSDERSLFT